MGFLTAMIPETRSDEFDMNRYIQSYLTGDDYLPVNTSAGVPVSESNSLSIAAVYDAVRLISWTKAMLPLVINKRLKPSGKERAHSHYLYNLIHNKPNDEQTSFEWRSLTMTHELLWGAGISEIEFDKVTGVPVALWPIPPWRVEPKRLEDGSIYYVVKLDDGEEKLLASFQVLVFKMMSTSSYKWLSPIELHRETIGLDMSQQDYAAKIYGSGINPAGILSGLSFKEEDTEATIKKKYGDAYAGLNAGKRLMLLEDGVKFERVGMPPQDAQYIESRKFSVEEIARIYNIPVSMLKSHEKSTSWGTGLEEFNIWFVTYTLMPYIVQWEQEITRRLFDGDNEYYPKFVVDALLRGKYLDRMEGYSKGVSSGVYTPNEARGLEDRNPKDGGDTLLVPLNLQSVKYAGEKKEVNKTGGDNNAK